MKQYSWMYAALPLGLACAFARAGSVDLFIDPSFGSTEETGATALVSLAFSDAGLTQLMTVTMENSTPVEIGSRLTAVGFELPAGLAFAPSFAAEGRSDYFDVLTFAHSVSPPWLDAPGGFDLMITSDGNFLGGNPNGAPKAGEVQTVMLDLGDTGMSPGELEASFRTFYETELTHVAIGRFQSVGPNGEGSDKVAGRIPEPSTLVLLACGALSLSFRRRRK